MGSGTVHWDAASLLSQTFNTIVYMLQHADHAVINVSSHSIQVC